MEGNGTLGMAVDGDNFAGYRIIFVAPKYPNGIAVDSIYPVEATLLAQDPRPIPAEENLTLRAEKRGPQLRVWVDEKQKGSRAVTESAEQEDAMKNPTTGRLLITAATCLATTFAANAAERSLAIRDTIGRGWADEPITWPVEFKPGERPIKSAAAGKTLLPAVTRNGQPIQAQGHVLELARQALFRTVDRAHQPGGRRGGRAAASSVRRATTSGVRCFAFAFSSITIFSCMNGSAPFFISTSVWLRSGRI